MFFVLEFVGVYFASYESLTGLTELHQTIRTTTEVRKLRLLLNTANNLYQASHRGLKADELEVFTSVLAQERQLLQNLLVVTEKETEPYNLMLSAQKSIEAMNSTTESVLSGVPATKAQELMVNQYLFESHETLMKVQTLLAEQSDRIFDRIYRSRFLPLTIGIALSLVFLLIVLAVGLNFRKKLGLGINNLLHATKSIAEGNLNVQTEIIESDEIGLLTNAFNVMAKDLQESTYTKAYVEGILESILNAVLVINSDGAIMRINRACAETFGFTADELLQSSIQSILPEISSGGATGKMFESTGVKKDKTRFPVLVSVSRLDEQRMRSADLRVCVVQDISDSKKLELEIKERNHALNLANQELEAFSYSVSHDLRAPLRAIDGFSQALLEDSGAVLNDESKNHLERIRFGVQRMGDLIDAVINLAKISRASMVITKVDISQLVQEIIEDLRHMEPQRKVEVKVQPDLVTDADSVLLKITMENLLGNAWKYTSKKPVAHIEFGQTGQNTKVKIYYVKDDGVGFDMAYAGKLFAPFQRLHAQSEFSGTGVGLASVKRVIQRHGGTIWVESKPDEGTTFFFTLNS